MKPLRSDTILLLVANPVDALTYFAQKYADLPKNQVIGSGTFLDSARLRGILANKADVAASSIASIGGVPLSKALPNSSDLDKNAIAEETKNKATNIINNKGVTNYGIGAVAASICKSILFDQRNIRPVSHWQEKLGVCLSLPTVLGRAGVVRTVECPLNEEEEAKLEESAKALREMVNE
jgi:L-lactate dehydrogenase